MSPFPHLQNELHQLAYLVPSYISEIVFNSNTRFSQKNGASIFEIETPTKNQYQILHNDDSIAALLGGLRQVVRIDTLKIKHGNLSAEISAALFSGRY